VRPPGPSGTTHSIETARHGLTFRGPLRRSLSRSGTKRVSSSWRNPLKDPSPLPELLLFLLLFSYASTAAAQAPGAFAPTGNMTTPRVGHTATVLNNGQVLIAGGGISSAELYDPNDGSFVATGSMTTARVFHTATLLPNGKVLIVGGRQDDGRQVLASAELYDPDTRTFTPTGDMNVGRVLHTATLLNNGQVLIVGGWAPSPFGEYPLSYNLTSAELYDPLTGAFTATGNMSVGLFGFTATLLSDGKVLITSAYCGDAVWGIGNIGPFCGDAGGNGELYDPLTGAFTHKGTRTNTGGYGLCYWHTASLLPNGKVLIAGGGDADNGIYGASAGIYEPGSGTFAATGNMTTPRYLHTATVLLDNTVLITGGWACCSYTTASAELYNPESGTFTYVGDMTKPRAGHTATRLNNGAVLIAGGSSHTASTELYVPSPLVPALVVTDLRFDRSSVTTGSSFSVNVSGSNLTPQVFFDVRVTTPGSYTSDVVLNWQKGLAATHSVPAGTASGIWTITGVRAHEIETDHTGNFVPVKATVTVSP
jgi:hypothetical protein